MNTKRYIYFFIATAFLFLTFYGCKIGSAGKWSMGYSFSGASVPAGTTTASVQYFQNRATIVQPLLARMLTEKLKDKIESQTSLKIVNGLGDANFEGTIDSYTSTPSQVSGGENVTASLNRLEIKINVKYTNSKGSEFQYESPFSRYIEYDANKTLDQVEKDELDKLVDLLIDDIFNKAFVNW
jgi:hypothetical protein